MVLCLDGAEWVDAATWDVCEWLLKDKALEHKFALICVHRVEHKNTLLHQQLSFMDATLETIPIHNFGLATTHSYLTELLNTQAIKTESLAKLVHEKVDGNPFFLRQFLLALTDSGLLSYNLGPMAWIWDEYAIRTSATVTDNVLNVFMDKVGLLNGSTQRILCIAANLGPTFDKNVLELVAASLPHCGDDYLWMSCNQKNTIGTTQESLYDAVEHNLVDFLPDQSITGEPSTCYRFVHTDC